MTTDTSAEALEESIFWLKAKYRRHGEIEDRIAAEQLEYFQAEKRRPREGVTDESKARAWNNYYSPDGIYPEQERAMGKQFTANDVRRLSNRIPRSNDEIADAQEALRAFANMLEAREKAVPVAWMHFYRKNGGGTRMWFPTLVPKAEPQDGYEWVETRPLQENIRQTPADAERLAEALRQIAVTTKGYPNASREGEIAIKALAAHSSQAQPPAQSKYVPPYPDQSDEWAVVPRVPTKAMIDACCKIKLDRLEALRDGHGASSGIVAAVQEEWAAMIAAAPRKRHDTINLLEDSTAQPPAASVTDESVLVPIKDESWPPIRVIRAMLDCQEADPADGSESEAYYGLRAAMKEWQAALAAQEKPNE